MQIYDIGKHRLVLAELGQDACSSVLDRRVSVVYNAPPNPDTINWWRGYKTVTYTYRDFLDALFELYKQADADEYYVECGKNRTAVVEYFHAHGYIVQERPILYSAPIYANSCALTKRRIPYTLVTAARTAITSPEGQYSHEVLNDILFRRTPGETVFDPCIGKGLALRISIANGLQCVGIEASPERLQCCIDYAKKEMG